MLFSFKFGLWQKHSVSNLEVTNTMVYCMDDLVENFVTKCSFKVHPSLVSIWYEMLRKNRDGCVLEFEQRKITTVRAINSEPL